MEKISYYYNKFKFGEDSFHNLMKNRVREILLVSTFYDAFIFEQDGRLSEQIIGEYRQLNLSTAPRITSVPTGEQALKKMEKRSFDLIITMMRIGNITPFELGKRIKEKNPDLPILLLLNIQADISLIKQNENKMKYIDDVFLWNGDTKLFLAMIKQAEDKRNIEYDTKNGFVRAILLIEDSIIYYSMFLPILYAEILQQTQLLISEELSDVNKRLRMRARPKVILVHNYEDAVKYLEKYREYLVGVISDVSFSNKGIIDPQAGIKIINKIKMGNYDIPIILQSSEIENEKKVKKLGAVFLHKQSKTLLHDLKQIIKKHLGYGDFIFRNRQEKEIGRAKTIWEFEKKLHTVPGESLLYHGERHHFSSWLVAHGEILVARKIRPIQINDFKNTKELRKHLLDTFRIVRQSRTRGKIINFEPSALKEVDQVIRLAEGSLGGKGRGLAFLNALLVTMEFEKQFPEVNISLPSTAIIGTSEFDSFIAHNKIGEGIIKKSDKEIQKIFINGKLYSELTKKLKIYIKKVTSPIAVRSSGLLEDSQSQPFAGIYNTFMLPNNHPDKNVRLKQLTDAIKLVFSSIFLKGARNYIESINYKIEEEKMAVIIQEIVGNDFDGYYYPHISGVAESYNFYPTSNLKISDGVALLAVGLGKTVVESEQNYRFCPKYPKIETVSPEEMVRDSQKYLFAINMKYNNFNLLEGDECTLTRMSIKEAERHGSLQHLVSVWDYQNNKMVYGLSAKGLKVITFADILKYNYFPLAKIIEQILEIGEKAMGIPVEIEFAINLNKDIESNIYPTFYVLQIRPLTINLEEISINPDSINRDALLLYTQNGLGNGVINDLHDIIYIDPEKFDKTKTILMREEISYLNEKMKKEDRDYVLIGPGRWGSRDRFLGIPIKWADIFKAKIIVETSFDDFIVDASQGTHFFHNLVAMNVGYFHIPYHSETDFISWDWLIKQNIVEKTNYFIHVKMEHPMVVKMDGRKGIATISK